MVASSDLEAADYVKRAPLPALRSGQRGETVSRHSTWHLASGCARGWTGGRSRTARSPVVACLGGAAPRGRPIRLFPASPNRGTSRPALGSREARVPPFLRWPRLRGNPPAPAARGPRARCRARRRPEGPYGSYGHQPDRPHIEPFPTLLRSTSHIIRPTRQEVFRAPKVAHRHRSRPRVEPACFRGRVRSGESKWSGPTEPVL